MLYMQLKFDDRQVARSQYLAAFAHTAERKLCHGHKITAVRITIQIDAEGALNEEYELHMA